MVGLAGLTQNQLIFDFVEVCISPKKVILSQKCILYSWSMKNIAKIIRIDLQSSIRSTRHSKEKRFYF